MKLKRRPNHYNSNRFVGYEREKEALRNKAMTSGEYERRIKAIARKRCL